MHHRHSHSSARAVRMLAVAACSLALWGCASDPCTEAAKASPSLVVGTGATAFEPLGEAAGYEFGPQGGWHVFGSLQATGIWNGATDTFDETSPLVSFTLREAGGAFTGGYEERLAVFSEPGDGLLYLIGELLILDLADISVAEGATVDLEATVEDACGTVIRAEGRTMLSESAL